MFETIYSFIKTTHKIRVIDINITIGLVYIYLFKFSIKRGIIEAKLRNSPTIEDHKAADDANGGSFDN